jgi:hypothetical protein
MHTYILAQVVEEQANSDSLPANAMAPGPPLTIRARRAADAAAARRAMPGVLGVLLWALHCNYDAL